MDDEPGFTHVAQVGDFYFNNWLMLAFVERWRPETHSFHMSWGKCTINLQDIAYHLVLQMYGERIGGCSRDLIRHTLGALPPSGATGECVAVLVEFCHTRLDYHSLCMTINSEVGDLARFIPLIVFSNLRSWLYNASQFHRFEQLLFVSPSKPSYTMG
ncbi:hypothetical protein AHAS_Ahas07G0174400 [Arachis hypogaea]